MNENDISQEFSSSNDEEYTPKLFSEDQNYQAEGNEDVSKQESTYSDSEQLFDQEINEDEDFEIPAFLRKQKF